MKKSICFLLAFVNIVLLTCGCSKNTEAGKISETDIFGVGGVYDYFEKSRDWKQYSTSNYFKFSDKEVFDYSEEVLDPDDKKSMFSYYTKDFGTFPVMAGIGYGKLISFEFARQHYSGSYEDIQKLTRANPIYTFSMYSSNFYDSLHKDSGLSWGEIILSSNDKKEVTLRTERPADVLFDLSGVPADKSVLEFKEIIDEIEYDTVCYDSMVFFTGKDNKIDSLTAQQVRDIYSGKLTNWKDVGGEDAEIDVYHRGDSTMNRDYMEKVVMSGLEIKESNMIKLNEPWEYLDMKYEYYPKEYVNSKISIGYGYKSLVDKYYSDDIKILSIDGIEPTDENVRSAKYKYSIPCLAATRKDKTGDLGKKVIEWLKSEEGKKSMEQIGFVAVK